MRCGPKGRNHENSSKHLQQVGRLTAVLMALGTLAQPAAANPGAIEWILAETGRPLEVEEIGEWKPWFPKVNAFDAVGLPLPHRTTFVEIDDGAARFFVLRDPATSDISKAALVFSDATVSCGGIIGDMSSFQLTEGTTLGAFLDPETAWRITEVRERLSEEGRVLSEIYNPQIADDHMPAQFITLPGGDTFEDTTFPVFVVGRGGWNMVYTLDTHDGQIAAIYVDVLGAAERPRSAGQLAVPPLGQLRPPPCTALPR